MISPDYIQQGLMRRGLPAHIAQGFVMNMQDESGLNPGINEISPTAQGSRGGYGLYQLTGPRRVAYEAYAQRRGTALDDPDAQLDFLMSELQGTEKNAARSILSTQNPQDAAVAIARDFLRPSASNLEKRVNRYKGSSPMIREEPKGLLDSLGIQKMEEGAGGEAGQRFYQRDSFKDTAAVLARGFAAMGSNPALQQMTADIAEQRTENRARNKTAEYLRNNNRADLADMVEKGLIGGREAAAQLLRKDGPVKGVAVGDKLVNPMTGEVIYEDTSAPGFDPKDVVTARKEFVGLPEVKQFAGQTSAYGRVIASVEDPSPAGDLALIFNFMKVLDPGSVVREGEFATAQNAGSIDERTRSLYNRIVSGERLTPEQRSDFADRATKLYTTAQGQYENVAGQYSSFAEAAGLPVEQVIPDFSYSGGLYQKPLEFSRPPAPAGVDPDDWAAAWSGMTEAERREFIDGGSN